METTNNQTPEIPENNKRKTYRKARENQLVFIEYSKPNDHGHIITVNDSYRNTVGRIHEQFDEEKQEIFYLGLDHENKVMFQKPDLESVKKEFQSRKEILFKEAYARRLEKLKQQREQKSQEKGHELSR